MTVSRLLITPELTEAMEAIRLYCQYYTGWQIVSWGDTQRVRGTLHIRVEILHQDPTTFVWEGREVAGVWYTTSVGVRGWIDHHAVDLKVNWKDGIVPNGPLTFPEQCVVFPREAWCGLMDLVDAMANAVTKREEKLMVRKMVRIVDHPVISEGPRHTIYRVDVRKEVCVTYVHPDGGQVDVYMDPRSYAIGFITIRRDPNALDFWVMEDGSVRTTHPDGDFRNAAADRQGGVG